MTAQTILPANTLSSGDLVTNSLRFNSASSDYLNRTTGTATSTTKMTFSTWVKRSSIATSVALFSFKTDGNNELYFRFMANDTLQVYSQKGGTKIIERKTNRVFRDNSAWYHLVLQIDTTHGTVANRIRIYVNGVQETSFSASTNPDQNETITYVASATFEIGRKATSTNIHMDGYLAETVFLDGLDHGSSFFGEFDSDSGIWTPINVSGFTFGNNGFYLQYKEAGTDADASGMGADTSGETNHFTVNNLTAVDQSIDTCQNNFATLNPLQKTTYDASNAMVLREGNLQLHGSTDGGPKFEGASTIGVSSGKWYAEFKSTISNNVFGMVGVDSNPGELARNDKYPGFYANSYGYFKDGEKYTGNSGSSYGNAWTNDTIGVALDLDNNKLYFSKNGTFQNSGDPTTGATGTGAISITAASSTTAGAYFFVLGDTSTSYINPFDCNFGSPMHSISSGNADDDGFGNFEYAVPSGYFALCTKNLAEYG